MTMTDDPDFLDELLSRYLDGEATAEDVARIESDPGLVARAARLRDAVDLVGREIPIPTEDLDRIRAAAIAQSTTTTAVSDLDDRRAQKLQNRNRFLAAAAVFVFLAVGYTAIQSSSVDDDDTASIETTADAASDDAGDDAMSLSAEADDSFVGGDDSGADMAADADMLEEAEAATDDDADEAGDHSDDGADGAAEVLDVLPDDLGVVENLAELTDLVNDLRAVADAEGRFAPAPEPGTDDICDGLLALLQTELPAGLLSVEVAPVEVSGLAQRVALGTGFDGATVAVLIADEACAVLEVLEIDGG